MITSFKLVENVDVIIVLVGQNKQAILERYEPHPQIKKAVLH